MAKLSMQDLADVIGEDAIRQGYETRIKELKGAAGVWVGRKVSAGAIPHSDDLPPGIGCICGACCDEELAGLVEQIKRVEARRDGAKAALVGEEPIQIGRAERRRKR